MPVDPPDTVNLGDLVTEADLSSRHQSGLRGVVSFTADGTFTKGDHPWLRAVRVRVQGAGGAGGGAQATASGEASCGGGGGGGAYAESYLLASALATSVTVTVGTGGTGVSGDTGNNGEASSFGSHVVAGGGLGGPTRATSTVAFGEEGGSGGTASAGEIQTDGDAGKACFADGQLGIAGNGGASHLGGGGIGRNTTTAGQSIAGLGGRDYGGGGGGSINAGGVSAIAGAAGADGIVIVELYA